jgi:hypothetical protein
VATSAVWVVPLWIAYGTYYALSEGVGKAMVADLAPTELRATAFGILNSVQGVMILPASVIAGLLWSLIAPPAPFWFGAALCGRGGRAAAGHGRGREPSRGAYDVAGPPAGQL